MGNDLNRQRYKQALDAMRDETFVLIVLPKNSDHFQMFMRGLNAEDMELVRQLVEAINGA